MTTVAVDICWLLLDYICQTIQVQEMTRGLLVNENETRRTTSLSVNQAKPATPKTGTACVSGKGDSEKKK